MGIQAIRKYTHEVDILQASYKPQNLNEHIQKFTFLVFFNHFP